MIQYICLRAVWYDIHILPTYFKIEELFNFGFVQFRSLQLKPLPTQVGFHLIIIIVQENRVNLFEKLFYLFLREILLHSI